MNRHAFVADASARLDRAAHRVVEEARALEVAKAQHADAESALALTQKVAAGVQESCHARVSSVVSRCLSAVFGPDAYSFRVRFEQKRGKTDALLEFVRNGVAVDPLSAAGGGVIDVASFALRLAALLLSRPRRRLLLVLDEPFRHLSATYLPAARALLESLARELSVKFVIVTHNDALRVGNVVEVGENA